MSDINTLIQQSEKLLADLIEEARKMDAYIKDDDKRVNYRELKQRQLDTIAEMIEALKNPATETIYLEVPAQKPIFETPRERPLHFEDMSIKKIQGLYGKEQARNESLRRAQEFMEYQEERYGLKSKQ